MLNRAIFAALVIAGPAPALAQGVPQREGTCVTTRVAALEHRLQDGERGPFIPGSGSAVRYANGVYQVSYDELPQLRQTRLGDPVMLCLVQIPHGCPPGDKRGRIYTATDLRILASWTMPDSEHRCGGA